MHDKFKHVNSVGQVMHIGSDVLVNYNDLRDFAWDVQSTNERITGFSKGIVKKTIPLICFQKDRNAIFEHFEIDVLNEKAGYFEINGYRFYCFATQNKKSEYLIDDRYMQVELELTSDKPEWIKETSYLFNKLAPVSVAEGNPKKYDYTYPYKYDSNDNFIEIRNGAVGYSDVIIRMFGPSVNPFVKIGETIYQINSTIVEGEYIEINTEERSVHKVSEYGVKENLFNLRSKKRGNFFEKVPSGLLKMSTGEMTSAEVVVLEKRSEPKWN